MVYFTIILVKKINTNIILQEIKTPNVLFEEVIEVSCRVIPASKRCRLERNFFKRNVKGTTNEELHVIEELDESNVTDKLLKLKHKGIKSIAVVLMHSYT